MADDAVRGTPIGDERVGGADGHRGRGGAGAGQYRCAHVGCRFNVARARRGRGAGAVVVVGSDIPALGPSQIDAALRALTSNDLVFGPARDGGYYLLGAADGFAAEFLPLFDDAAIPWSTDAVLSASLAVAAAERWRVGTIEPLTDVDTAADIGSLRAELDMEPDRARARRMREFLARLEEEGLA